nr:hypothetical protein BaRGS_030145 [Batillaria attramentaria]
MNNEVLIKMLLAPVHPIDLDTINGFTDEHHCLPAVGGCEGVGVVEKIGCGAIDLNNGDWVVSKGFNWGTWQTMAVADAADVMRVPKDIPLLGAATLAGNACTALLKDFVDLKPRDVIIQNGANGAVGQAVMQLAREWGIITVNVVLERYFWHGMKQEVEDYCRSCCVCQNMNACRKKPAAPLHPIPVPKKKWSLVGMDIIGPLQVTDRGNQYIVALTDHFTKFPVAKAIPCKSSEEVARFMYETICIFGAFDSLITDQGREFINFALDILTDRFNINHRISSAYHPETNGQRERDNRTLKDTLVKITDNDDWDELLPAALFAYRTSVHKSTQFSPFLALYGEQAKLPFDVTGDANEQDLNEEIMDTMKGIHEEVKNKIGENISRAQKKQKEYYDSRRAYDHGFRIGDKVLIINAARVHRMGGKMAPRFVGPYEFNDMVSELCELMRVRKFLPPDTDYFTLDYYPLAIRFANLDIIAGTGYYTPEELPAVAGNEGVGVVVQTGSNVTTIHLGDWVIPKDVGWGTWRQWAFTTEKDVVKVPNNLPLLGAATLGCYPCTAYRMLKGILNLGPGDVVFQNSVYSNVGLAVIQLAKQWEITTVNVLRDGPNTDQQSKELREFGATHVITDKFLRSAEMQYFVEALPSKPRLAFNCAGWVLHEDIKEHLHDVIMVTYGDMSRKHVTAPEGETIEQVCNGQYSHGS